jgi:hypothetical protein
MMALGQRGNFRINGLRGERSTLHHKSPEFPQAIQKPGFSRRGEAAAGGVT